MYTKKIYFPLSVRVVRYLDILIPATLFNSVKRVNGESCKTDGGFLMNHHHPIGKFQTRPLPICSSSDLSEALHLAATGTEDIDKKVRNCDNELNDERIIAALSAGYMVSMLNSILNVYIFYNRRRASKLVL
jgi:hypothetical protein